MFASAAEALAMLFDPSRFVFLLLGVAVGLIVGVLPGLSGVAGMSLLLPFLFGMDPYSGIALLIGMLAVTSTSDTFPSVLIGVPGTASAQATIMDGYPLARQGRAGEALGAAFTSSMIGGLLAAVAIFALIPVARPLVLLFESPQLLMLSLLGLSMVALISTGRPLAGILSGVMGLMFSAVGNAPAGGIRYDLFDWKYLSTGISLTLVALGLFAIPEFVALYAEGAKIASTKNGSVKVGSLASLLRGAGIAVRHRALIFVSSVVSVVLGMIPGIGSAAVQWIIYGGARQTLKNTENFGRGDIRGVIAPEASNNAVDGGALIPTTIFGIPGNGATAMLLGGFVLLGIQPGPTMVSDSNMPLLLTIVWSFALANVMATFVCFLASNAMVRMTRVPSRALVPYLSVLIIIAAYQSSQRWGDIIILLAFGLLGWIMKSYGWPRAPLLIGFVLGNSVERYLRISLDRFGTSWLTDPYVVGIFVVIVILMGYSIRAQLKIRAARARSRQTLSPDVS